MYIALNCTGTGKSKTCVELIKRFIGPSCVKEPPAKEPAILYCAPSNKAVNVGACKIMFSCYLIVATCYC